MPVPPQPRGRVGETVTGLMAGHHAVDAKVAEIVAQFTPGRQHRDFGVVDDGNGQAGAFGQLSLPVAVNKGKAAALSDSRPEHSHVGRRRCSEIRDHEPAVVHLVPARLGQNAGDLCCNATGSGLEIPIAGAVQELQPDRNRLNLLPGQASAAAGRSPTA